MLGEVAKLGIPFEIMTTPFTQITSIAEITSMHPERFEYFCKFILEHMDYEGVLVTKYYGDGGVDIRGWKDGHPFIGQCKRITKGFHGYVPIKEIRALGGCMLRDKILHGIFMATLPFSTLDQKEAEKMKIKLIGLEEIYEVMKRINLNFTNLEDSNLEVL